ncbi:hypothetical protein R4255_30855 [Rhodococcus oxybenzonivorans]|nr:hypothetical protein [Rhodococcus oxybenzonivorans]MDV7347831.1 hypothetical protein [Rhodococcus oxybenzonivorans]
MSILAPGQLLSKVIVDGDLHEDTDPYGPGPLLAGRGQRALVGGLSQ